MNLDLVQDDAQYEGVLDALRDAPRYGIDTEFVRERTYRPVLALVQVAWPGGLALLDPLKLDMRRLRPVLEGDGLAIMHAGLQDLSILEQECGAAPARFYDTQIAAAFLGFGTASLFNLVKGVLDVKLSKGDQLTDWTRRPLSESARRYAASDVEYLLDLHDLLTARLGSLGRETWAVDEMDKLKERASTPVDPDRRWWKLKGKARLRGESRGVAQALTAWREGEAARKNVPVKRVLGDMAILGMAGRPPRSARDLERVRGLGRMDSKTEKSILAAVREGIELRAPELKLPPTKSRGDDTGAAAALCSAWLQQLAKANDLESSMLATRDDLGAFLRGEASRLDEGWRSEIAGQSMRALMDGKAALYLEDGQLALAPR